jgi:hypothetical protein
MTISEQALFEALAWVADRGLSGAIEVTGDKAGATLFFSDGHPCFGLVGGEGCVPVNGGGIAPDVWLQALASPAADLDLGAALLLAGAAERQVQRFVKRSIDAAVAAVGRNASVEIRFVDRRSPIGSMFRFDVSNWIPQTATLTIGVDVTDLTRIA